MKKSSRSFEIALSAISAAIGGGMLMLGSVSPFLLAAGYLIASFSIMIPLSKDFVWGAALCYLAEGLIAVFVATVRLVPYAVFFGLHPIVNYLQRKYVKKRPLQAVCLLLKTAWFDLSLWLSYFVLKTIAGIPFPAYLETYLFWIIFLGGTVFFLVYDQMIFFCQKSADAVVRKFGR